GMVSPIAFAVFRLTTNSQPMLKSRSPASRRGPSRHRPSREYRHAVRRARPPRLGGARRGPGPAHLKGDILALRVSELLECVAKGRPPVMRAGSWRAEIQ